MREQPRQPEKNSNAEAAGAPEPESSVETPMARFKRLTKRLLAVPVAETRPDRDGGADIPLPVGGKRRV
jgi:hypothetical protein